MGIVLENSTEVRRMNTYAQLESGRGCMKSGNGWMSPYNLCNICFTFDNIDIYLQLQVMPNAPYNILLCRPFYALTECITKDFANSDQHLTITDPNTWQCIMTLTKEQKRH
jgi:hypothetical protein